MGIINTAYIKDEGKCWGPVMLPGESYAFYINFDEPIADPSFANFRLDLIDSKTGETVRQGVGILKQDFLPDGIFYNIKCSFRCPDVVFGWYRLQIVDATTGEVKCTSNEINIEELGVVQNTAYVAYRDEVNKYNFLYENDVNYYNKIRLPLIQVGFSIETERKQYKNVTNRRLRNLKSYYDYVVTIQSYKYPEWAHIAINAVYDHTDIYLDNHYVTPKDDYELDAELRSIWSNGSQKVIVDLNVIVPLAAASENEFLVTNLFDEILANGDFISIHII